ncbi:MAG: hypothetical protein ACOX2O_08165 [Bdellovibrionota bacterium]|jgi:septal ring factor EnvC (AmiA/AmiB activator)
MTGLIIALIVAIVIIVGAAFFVYKEMGASQSSSKDATISNIKKIEETIANLIKSGEMCASKAQLETLTNMLKQVTEDLEKGRACLEGIESKLDQAQELVEKKEAQQQELKSSNEEDESRLAGLLSSYEDISTESVALERCLAEALKELDGMVQELELTPDQKDVLDDLSKVLSSAGALLRDLITEHASINERLTQIKQQKQDLEDEYTRLVEQQLGE